MVKKTIMVLASTVGKTEGTWTRIEGEKKARIDYVIIDEDDVDSIVSMKIDEDKLLTPYHIIKEESITGEVYSDSCAITWQKQHKDRAKKSKDNNYKKWVLKVQEVTFKEQSV